MSSRSLAVGLSLVAGLAALSGCVVAADDGQDGAATVGVAQSAIKGGYPDPDDHAVVGIAMQAGGGFGTCTGSLIAPNLVLTAQHCVAEILNGSQGVDCDISKFAKPYSASAFFVTTKQQMGFNASDYHMVSEVLVPGPLGVCGADVALLVLNTNVSAEEAVPLVPRVDSKSHKGDVYSAIGYGATVDDGNGTGAGQRRRLDNLIIDCVGIQCPSYYVDQQTEWVGDKGICQGDSGGPAIDQQGRVIGVTSRGASGCTSPVYGYVYGWADWIKAQGVHAAQVGGYPTPAWATGFPTDPQFNFPVGDACGDPPACASGLCLGDAAGSYCTRVCSDIAPCPEGYNCTDVGGQLVCQRPPPAPPTTTSSSGGTVSQKSGCSAQGADPTKPVPWSTGVGIAAAGLALLRRRRRGTTVDR